MLHEFCIFFVELLLLQFFLAFLFLNNFFHALHLGYRFPFRLDIRLLFFFQLFFFTLFSLLDLLKQIVFKFLFFFKLRVSPR